MCDGKVRPDEQCQNICHLGPARDLWTHIFKANVLREQRFKVDDLQAQGVKAKGIPTRLTMAYHTLATERTLW